MKILKCFFREGTTTLTVKIIYKYIKCILFLYVRKKWTNPPNPHSLKINKTEYIIHTQIDARISDIMVYASQNIDANNIMFRIAIQYF